MPKKTSDREDLLREATALTQRVELQPQGYDESAVIGFRANGAASFFLHPQQVYHFTTTGQLRRAYVDDQLIKAELGQLIALQRRQAQGEIQMVRHPFDAEQTEQFLAELKNHLSTLQNDLNNHNYQLIGQVPADADVISQILHWLQQHADNITIAAQPNLA